MSELCYNVNLGQDKEVIFLKSLYIFTENLCIITVGNRVV